MPKNIVVFSDGTGQDGGARIEARLSNVYKLYRASRIGPDTSIDPDQQIAFYDPGLGTDSDSHGLGRLGKTLYKWGASIAGRGIATNIADCYEFIVNHWQPGDRIFIFGFSRGAYTARCVAQVLSLCGVPTHASNDPTTPFKRFGRQASKVAARAVHQVYEHGAGFPRTQYEDERAELARRFRAEFGSDQAGEPNACPHFIGVFDTVAALGASGWKRAGLILGLLVVSAVSIAVISGLVSWIFGWRFWAFSLGLAVLAALILVGKLRRNSYRFIEDFPVGTKGRKGHYIRWRADNYDRGLSGHVGYARQASAIDETRTDFPRVAWGKQDVIRPRQDDEPEPMIQLYFAGNHSDIGGSYAEPESRLSDVALQWMLNEATSIPGPLLVEPARIQPFPNPRGIQHNEPESLRENRLFWVPRWAPKWLSQGWAETFRTANGFPMHPSVHQRFAADAVDQNGKRQPYRPHNLSKDARFTWYFGGSDPNQVELEGAQGSATYEVDADPPVAFAVGVANAKLAALLKAHQSGSAVGVFPGNPRPDADSGYLDALALRILAEHCRAHSLTALPVRRSPREPGGIVEEGSLVVGLDADAGCRLARSFGATTLIEVSSSGAAVLRSLVL